MTECPLPYFYHKSGCYTESPLDFLNSSVPNFLLFKNQGKVMKYSFFFQNGWVISYTKAIETHARCDSVRDLQLKPDQTERLLNKPYVNEVHLTGQKLT